MHHNLERRFRQTATARSQWEMALAGFRVRYPVLFAALAADMGLTADQLGARVGFSPMHPNGNAITWGDAEASVEDCIRLLDLYLEHRCQPTPNLK